MAIGGATGTSYTLADADKDNYIYFSVTPKAASVTLTGSRVMSANVGRIR
jgi:hypothetical protein